MAETGEWLDADIVDDCCAFLVDFCTAQKPKDANSVIFVSSLAISVALQRLNEPECSQDSIHRAMGIGVHKAWPPRDLACFSVNGGAHWSLLAYFPVHAPTRIYHYDSGRHFDPGNNANRAREIVTMMARVRLVPAKIELVEEGQFPVQEGYMECGYYLIAAMANLMWHRRKRLELGVPITPLGSFTLNLLNSYTMRELHAMVNTLLLKTGNYCHSKVTKRKRQRPAAVLDANSKGSHKSQKTKKQKTKEETVSLEKTIFPQTSLTTCFANSFDSYDNTSDHEEEEEEEPDNDDDDEQRENRR